MFRFSLFHRFIHSHGNCMICENVYTVLGSIRFHLIEMMKSKKKFTYLPKRFNNILANDRAYVECQIISLIQVCVCAWTTYNLHGDITIRPLVGGKCAKFTYPIESYRVYRGNECRICPIVKYIFMYVCTSCRLRLPPTLLKHKIVEYQTLFRSKTIFKDNKFAFSLYWYVWTRNIQHCLLTAQMCKKIKKKQQQGSKHTSTPLTL